MKRAFSRAAIALIAILTISGVRASADERVLPTAGVRTIALEDGSLVDETIIDGPPRPPPGYELERASVALPAPDTVAGTNVLTVPAYAWSFGCTATSGAMIAGYYDRTGYGNMYAGPTNGGMMPPDSSAWPRWIDGNGDTYDQCPLTASRLGLDGRAGRGSIDDYWIAYGSTARIPT